MEDMKQILESMEKQIGLVVSYWVNDQLVENRVRVSCVIASVRRVVVQGVREQIIMDVRYEWRVVGVKVRESVFEKVGNEVQ